MPILNLNGIKKIYHGNQVIKRLYLGEQKLWEGRRTVTGKFFSHIAKLGLGTKVFFYLDTTAFNSQKIKPTDIAYYVGKSGKEYPMSFLVGKLGEAFDIPLDDAYSQSENHTLILKD